MLNDARIDTKRIIRGALPVSDISRYTIRTSGRRVFRRCMRKWGFQSSMKMNLERKGTEQNIHFWFGSAIHFAMEEYFGYNRFGDLTKAFQAYYASFPPADRPMAADQHYFLGLGMLDYFKEWYPKHNEQYGFQTVWLDENKQEVEPGTAGAKPLIEGSFMLDLNYEVWVDEATEKIIRVKEEDVLTDDEGRLYLVGPINADDPFTENRIYILKVKTYYHGTLDRVVRDRLGRWWIMDWKTAKSADTNKLDTDDQISAYLWAAEQWYGRKFHGFVYVQLTKDVAKPPKRLTNGALSVDKKQKTSYGLVKAAIIKDYGEVRKAPVKVMEFLNNLAAEESPEGDRFIRWDLVTRNDEQKISTYRNIMAEVKLMSDPDLYLFPNPTRDCIWDCDFRDACLMMERGQTDEAMKWLKLGFEPRPREEDGNIENWRVNIPWPELDQGKAIGALNDEMELDASRIMNVILPEKYMIED